MITSPPEFPVAMRGYERNQVDAYVEDLRRRLDEAERVKAASPTQEPPEPAPANGRTRRGADANLSALGERVTQILQLAEDDAADRRERGERDAETLRSQAQAEADQLRQAAQNEAEELRASLASAQNEAETVRAAARDEAEVVRGNARQEAQDLLLRTRRHADDQAESIVAKAESEARRTLEDMQRVVRGREEEWEQRRSEQEAALASLEQRRSRIVGDFSRLRAALLMEAEEEEAAASASLAGASQPAIPAAASGQTPGDDAAPGQPAPQPSAAPAAQDAAVVTAAVKPVPPAPGAGGSSAAPRQAKGQAGKSRAKS